MSDTAERKAPSPVAGEGLVRRLFAEEREGVTQLFFTTNPGLEDVVVGEFSGRMRAAGLEGVEAEEAPFGLGGHVLVSAPHPAEKMQVVAMEMRSVHHVLRPLYAFALPEGFELEAIERELEALEIDEMRSAASFRVTSRRNGAHAFTSIDVQRAAGAALVRRYGCAVDLENYDLNVRVDVFEQLCLAGVQLTERALSKRFDREYQPRTALKAPVAFAMLRFAGLGDEGALLDPFCGSGTLLLEAAQLFPRLQLFGCDKDLEAVEGTRRNARAAGVEERLHLRQGDARRLSEAFPGRQFQAIVTNPPYGVQMGHHLNFSRFYQQILRQAWKALVPGGLLVLLVFKRGAFTRAVERVGLFRQRHVRVVETGDIYPRIFVLERER